MSCQLLPQITLSWSEILDRQVHFFFFNTPSLNRPLWSLVYRCPNYWYVCPSITVAWSRGDCRLCRRRKWQVFRVGCGPVAYCQHGGGRIISGVCRYVSGWHSGGSWVVIGWEGGDIMCRGAYVATGGQWCCQFSMNSCVVPIIKSKLPVLLREGGRERRKDLSNPIMQSTIF